MPGCGGYGLRVVGWTPAEFARGRGRADSDLPVPVMCPASEASVSLSRARRAELRASGSVAASGTVAAVTPPVHGHGVPGLTVPPGPGHDRDWPGPPQRMPLSAGQSV